MKLDFATTALLTNMKLNELPPFSALTPEEARLVYSEMAKSRRRPGTDNVSAEDVSIATMDGAAIEARILRPEGQAKAIIVYFHGGGWVIGNIDDFDPLAASWPKPIRRLLSWSITAKRRNMAFRFRWMIAGRRSIMSPRISKQLPVEMCRFSSWATVPGQSGRRHRPARAMKTARKSTCDSGLSGD